MFVTRFCNHRSVSFLIFADDGILVDGNAKAKYLTFCRIPDSHSGGYLERI